MALAAVNYEAAAEQGISLAQARIGFMYKDGVGVEVNP